MSSFQSYSIAAVIILFASIGHAQNDSCQLGVNAAKRNDHTVAITHYSKCLEGAPPVAVRAKALRNRALSYGQLKQHLMAMNDQRAALSIDAPTNVWPLIMLSTYARGNNQFDIALAALQAATKLDEDGPGTGPGMAVSYHTGQTLHALGRYQEAIEAFTLGIPKQPDYGYAFYRRALSYEALGEREMAKRDLIRTAELEPREGYEVDVAKKIKENGLAVRKVRTVTLD